MMSNKNHAQTDQLKQKNNNARIYQSKIKEVLCVQGCKAVEICVSKKCKQSAFSCNQQNCICAKAHQKCSNKKLRGLIKTIEQKLVRFEPIINEIENIITERIRQHKSIIEMLEAQKKSIQNLIYDEYNCGLSKTQSLVYKAMLNKKTDEIKGCNIFDIQKQLDQQVKFSIQQQVNKIKQAYKKYKSKFEDFEVNLIQELKHYFMQRNYEVYTEYFKSHIITSIDEFNFLTDQIQKKQIQNFELLYRASQNSFQLQKFKQKCINTSDTLTLIKTDYNLKIGFYTPNQWKKNSKMLIDFQEKNTILIAFSHLAYFKGFDIQYNENFGPCFIDQKVPYRSIKIPDRCDKTKLQNKKFVFTRNQVRQIVYEDNMKINEWEVWKINFIE